MPFLQREDRKLYYVVEPANAHTENTDTIILIHTNVMEHSIYDRMSSLLRDKFNVVRYDLAGFGLSELGEHEITLDMHVADFTHLVQALKLQSFYIIAIGFGGLIALEYNERYKGRIQKMVLMSMPCFPEETLHQVYAHRKKISQDGKFIPAHNILKKTTLLSEHEPQYQQLHQSMSLLPVSTYMSMMDLTLSANTIGYLRNNKTPTLILSGEHEIVFPQHWLAVECALLSNHHYTVVPNASSFLMIDQPEITTRLAKEFFKADVEPERYSDDISASIFEHIHHFTQQKYFNDMLPVFGQPANRITIDLIHTFRLTINGTPVKENLNKRYAKNILTYLLFHPTTTRNDICENLWPNENIHHARKNLRVYLSYLRKILNAYALSEPICIVDHESVQLNGMLSSDIFDLLSDLRTAADMGENEEKYALAKKILDQFYTPSFLTTIHDHWFLDIRTRIEREIVGLATWLGAWLTENKNEQEALHYLTKVMYLTADNIEIYDTLIELYERLNNDKQQQYWLREKDKVWGT